MSVRRQSRPAKSELVQLGYVWDALIKFNRNQTVVLQHKIWLRVLRVAMPSDDEGKFVKTATNSQCQLQY